MPQLSETAAEKLAPEQAAELVHILDLQARWENHRDDPAKSAASVADLRGRQQAFDAFRAAWRDYSAARRDARLPEPTQNVPDRLAVWLRALRAVYRRAETGSPSAVLLKVYRLADRIAIRTSKEPVERRQADDLVAAVEALDAVIAWCDAQTTPRAEAA